MRKAYWIAHVIVTEPNAYAKYANAATEAFNKYGGKVLARAGRVVSLEGEIRPRNVTIEFDSVEAAVACFHSPEYQRAKEFREKAGEVQLMILEGVDQTAS